MLDLDKLLPALPNNLNHSLKIFPFLRHIIIESGPAGAFEG
jgi:hypothetical protein